MDMINNANKIIIIISIIVWVLLALSIHHVLSSSSDASMLVTYECIWTTELPYQEVVYSPVCGIAQNGQIIIGYSEPSTDDDLLHSCSSDMFSFTLLELTSSGDISSSLDFYSDECSNIYGGNLIINTYNDIFITLECNPPSLVYMGGSDRYPASLGMLAQSNLVKLDKDLNVTWINEIPTTACSIFINDGLIYYGATVPVQVSQSGNVDYDYYPLIIIYDTEGTLQNEWYIHELGKDYYIIDIEVDAFGNIFVLAHNSVADLIGLAKLDQNGVIIWTCYWELESLLIINRGFLNLDSHQNVYVVSHYSGQEADLAPGPLMDIHSGNGVGYIFVTKLSNDGSFIWSRSFGGGYLDNATDVAVCSQDNIYITGRLEGELDIGNTHSNSYEINFINGNFAILGSAFICVIDSSGDLLWSDQWSTSSMGASICFDSVDNIYWIVNDPEGSRIHVLKYGVGEE